MYLGPVIGGGLIMLPSTWRATFWFLSAYGLCILFAVFFILPETYRVENLSENGIVIDDVSSSSSTSDEELGYYKKDEMAVSSEKQEPDSETPRSQSMNPVEPFFMLRHPFVLMASTISGVAFGAMYAVETIMPSLYQQHYGFVAWQTGWFMYTCFMREHYTYILCIQDWRFWVLDWATHWGRWSIVCHRIDYYYDHVDDEVVKNEWKID